MAARISAPMYQHSNGARVHQPANADLEVFLGALIEEVMAQPVLVLREASTGDQVWSKQTLQFEAPGESIAIDLGDILPRDESATQVIWSVDRFWRKHRQIQRFRLVGRWRFLSPLYEQSFRVYRCLPEFTLVGRLKTLSCYKRGLESDGNEVQGQRLQTSLSGRATLTLSLPNLDRRIGEVVKDNLFGYLTLPLASSASHLPVRMSMRGAAIIIEIQQPYRNLPERCMEAHERYNEQIALQLQVGEIEMSLADLLSLRPGSIIELDSGQSMKGSICLGTSKILEVKLSPNAEGLMITVEDYVFSDGRQFFEENEETLEEETRSKE